MPQSNEEPKTILNMWERDNPVLLRKDEQGATYRFINNDPSLEVDIKINGQRVSPIGLRSVDINFCPESESDEIMQKWADRIIAQATAPQ